LAAISHISPDSVATQLVCEYILARPSIGRAAAEQKQICMFNDGTVQSATTTGEGTSANPRFVQSNFDLAESTPQKSQTLES
jgi:hypothetical protein